MKKIPIVFSFNDGYVMPAGVCLTSLLENANENTFYDIFVLCSFVRLGDESRATIKSLIDGYSNSSITFIDVKNSFNQSYEIRNITIDAYYRLLIPELIAGYEKVIYSDVDVIFDKDLTSLYESDFKESDYILGRHDRVPSTKYLKSIGLDSESYINSGVLVMNIERMKPFFVKKDYSYLFEKKLLYQDQDIINIIYKDKIGFLEEKYNYTFLQNKDSLKTEDIHIFHYTGLKPWNHVVPFFDVWWSYYRKSVFFNDSSFYDTFYKLNYIKELENKIVINFLKKLRLRKLIIGLVRLIR